ncbi:hypothetical protein B9Z55_007668 [Caenorhabditis nigoni]|uniref:BTB domain-containing protein n=1 Tax=Caenorhabditis nigoni TaxID=1611254 RepID=A0A2G5VAZ2_9PELO|nr:hypothetical protein B9Z55_007668 [Caenorhabditis nigoni]
MTQPAIVYQSKGPYTDNPSVLDVSDTNGIKCTWSIDAAASLTWKFDWGELYQRGVERLTGYIAVTSKMGDTNNVHQSLRIEADLTETVQTITKTFEGKSRVIALLGVSKIRSFEYSLTPHYAPLEKVSYDALFAPSDMNDTVLVIEGKKIYVNKAFLSYQSDFFKALFSKNFKEGSLSEIEIKDVSYEDFGLLCSSFYPNPQFPNDQTVEKLLMMARRFLLPSVIAIVEYHLLHNSKIGAERMIWLADEYGMSKLLEKCIREMDSLEKAKKWQKSGEFEKLSDKTRSLILGRIIKFM